MIEREISLRDATAADGPFLACLYRDARRQEISAWGWPAEQEEAFLHMQFEAQCRSYRVAFPDATDRIICLASTSAGCLLVGRLLVGREAGGMRVIDIAMLEEHRNRGIGSELLRRLQQECGAQGCTLRLQVFHGNPAIRLYERLGFVRSGTDAMYVQMEWLPSPRTGRC